MCSGRYVDLKLQEVVKADRLLLVFSNPPNVQSTL